MGRSRRIRRFSAALIVIAAGLALRTFGYDLGLPFFVVKYGGSVLWGAMVFWLVAAVLTTRTSTEVIAVALSIAVSVELLRLYHTPWLDAFRLTTAGALLLGRFFSLWNILAYGIGIAAAALIEHRLSNEAR